MFFSPLKINNNRTGRGTTFWAAHKDGELSAQYINKISGASTIDVTRPNLVTYDSTFRNPVQFSWSSAYVVSRSDKQVVDVYTKDIDDNVDLFRSARIGGYATPYVDNVDWTIDTVWNTYSIGNLEDTDPQNTFIRSEGLGVGDTTFITISNPDLSPTNIQFVLDHGILFLGHNTATESTNIFYTDGDGEITYNTEIDNVFVTNGMLEASKNSIFAYTKYSDTEIKLHSFNKSDLNVINKIIIDTDVRGMCANGDDDLFAIIEDTLNWYDSNLGLVGTHVITDLNGESLKGVYRGIEVDIYDNIYILYYNDATERSTVDVFSQSQFTGIPYQSIQFDGEIVGIAAQFKGYRP